MNDTTTIKTGDRVVAGQLGTQDFDQGVVVAIDGSMATVAWDSEVRTTVPLLSLRLESDCFPCAWCDGLGIISDEEHGDCQCSHCEGTGEASDK